MNLIRYFLIDTKIDKLGWHADDEPELKECLCIAKDFRIRKKSNFRSNKDKTYFLTMTLLQKSQKENLGYVLTYAMKLITKIDHF